MSSDPSRVTAHRGMLSRKPTSSMMETISAGSVVAAKADRPEDAMMEDTIPWPMVNSAVISSIPLETAAWARMKRTKHLIVCSGF